MKVCYSELTRRIQALTDGETDEVALMATIACEVHHADDRFDWTGFYRVVDIDSNLPDAFTGEDAEALDTILRAVFTGSDRS